MLNRTPSVCSAFMGFTNPLPLKYAVFLSVLFLNFKLDAQTLIAGWDFQTAPGTAVSASPNTQTSFTANVGSGTLYLNGTNGASTWAAATELNAFGGSSLNAGGTTGLSTTTTSPSCLALLGGTSNSANSKSMVFKFSMSNFKDLVVSYATQKTASGFATQTWEYSTDGTAWSALSIVSTIPTAFAVQTLPTTAGLDNATTAYLRLTVTGATSASGNNRLDNIQLNATAGPSSTPSLSAAPSSISQLNYLLSNGPSTASNYTLTGANLTGDITLTAPTNFEISNTSATTGFGASLTISPVNGVIPSNTKVYVRLITGLAANAYSGNITHSGGGLAATVNVGVSGNVLSAATATLISTIQGSGTTAALTGVKTIEGIVTRTFLGSSKLNGFYVQEEDADSDNNPLTSEAIFVFDPAGLFAGTVGDKVLVTGTVQEFTSGTSSSLTQITSLAAVVIESNNNTLPNITNVQLPVTNLSDLERYEGMLVNLSATSGNLTVNNTFDLGRFGQLVLSVYGASNQSGTDPRIEQYTQFNAPSVAGNTAYQTEIAKRTIILDDGSATSNPDPIIFGRGGNPLSASNTLRGGDDVASIIAILDERFEGYRLQTTSGVNFQATNSRLSTSTAVGGRIKAGSFNLLNYFNGPSYPTSRGATTAAEFARQRDKTIQTLVNSGVDILALNELENDGYGASSAIQDLVDGVNAILGAGTYSIIVPTTSLATDLITVGMIYKSSKVQPDGAAATMINGYGSGAYDVSGRKPLAQTFIEISTGAKFTVVANHLKAKGSSAGGAGDADTNDGQAESNGTRTRQAQDLLTWIATKPTGTTDPDYLIVGDLNAYAMEDPITTLQNGGFTPALPNTSYSYSFSGQLGSLDHALYNAALSTQVVGAVKWHINSDEPAVLDYNVEFKSAGQQTSLYNADQYRTSDHDPVIVGLNLTTIIPLDLVDFSVNPKQNYNDINWTTVNEVNTQQFDIEKSLDGTAFFAIGTVKTKNAGAKSINYAFKDNMPSPELIYYRLKMIDADLSFKYSKTIAVKSFGDVSKTDLKIYPNPAQQTISVSRFDGFKSLNIYNLQGVLLLKTTQTEANVSNFGTGIYILEVMNTAGKTSVTRFLKE